MSRTRAEAVRKQFAINQLNLPDDIVRGFGSEMPVASNDTEEGREKNRRVEIWIKR